MAPFYQRYRPNFELHKDDVLGIQALYGESSSNNNSPYSTTSFPTTTTTTEHPTSSSSRPVDADEKAEIENELCTRGGIDAITRVVSGRTFMFKGDYYWKVETTGIADGYPRKISDGNIFIINLKLKLSSSFIQIDWGGLPGNLDAAITWADGKTFFFKVNRIHKF